jgi:tetratricopeptide (TPR) repeat protein
MPSKFVQVSLILASLLVLVGCDPETLIKDKVPKPIQSLLTFGSPAKSKAIVATLQLTAPSTNQLFAVGQEIAFQAEFRTGETKEQAAPQFTWMLFKEPDPKGLKAATAPSFKKKLEPGNYRVEVTATQGQQKLVKKSNFRVAYTAPGQVTVSDGAGLPGVKIVLTELNSDKVVFRTQTDAKGMFNAEVLAEGDFVVIPRKKEYSFSPIYKTAKLGRESSALDFKAVKAEVDKLRLTDQEQSDESLESLCPGQDAYLKLDLKAEDKPTRVDVFLVVRGKEKERLIQLDQVFDAADQKLPIFSEANQALHLKVPSAPNLGLLAPSYHLRVNFTDTKGNSYSAEAPNALKIDLHQCFRERFEQALAFHQKGELEKAAKSYGEAEQLGKTLQQTEQLPGDMPKIYFDRGLAQLGLAFAREPGDAKRLLFLGKALSDFNAVLKTHQKDADAILCRGIVNHSAGNYETAVKDYSAVLSVDPDLTEVKKLRAHAYVKSRVRENLSYAVDDFTDVISSDSAAQNLRKSRSAALKLFVQPPSKSDEKRVDIAAIPLPDMRQDLDLIKRIRK